MSTANQNLRNNYLDELDALRESGREFSRIHPDVAKELGMGADHWADSQAEMLAQSFAFLTARIRNQLEADRCAVPNALLNHLYPHLQAPMPCMSVLKAQAEMKSADGHPIERGRVFSVEAESARSKVLCRFTNCYDTPIWPLSIHNIESKKVKELDLPDELNDVSGAIKINIRTESKDPIQDLPIASSGLRFYISNDAATAGNLYELLCTSLKYVLIEVPKSDMPGEPARQILSPKSLRWCGFKDEEAALPDSATANPGYRLIREYFAFPQKFMFFELEGIEATGADREISIVFLFDDQINPLVSLKANSLQLNCFPAINLFEQAIEPIRLTRKKYEYLVQTDLRSTSNSEVYQIASLHSIESGKAPRDIAPCYELSSFDVEDRTDYFYSYRREISVQDHGSGTKSYISLMDMNMDVCAIPAEAIGGKALCTNRRLPEKLTAKSLLLLEGAGPVVGATLVDKMSEYTLPILTGNAPWQLVSQLHLNFLSIADDEKGLEAFKNILSVYTDPQNLLVLKQIHSLKSISTTRVARYVSDGNQRDISQGVQVRLKINEGDFRGISPVLFASVCRYFFALYASLGTFIELVLVSNKDRGDWKIWPPMAGALVDL